MKSSPPERDKQFAHIDDLKCQFLAAGELVISVDTKKELIGPFKNPGQAWRREPESVLVHGLPQDAIGQAIPFGIDELNHNHGFVRIGDCSDTTRFAAELVADWWRSAC